MILTRSLEVDLKTWIGSARRKPLIIRGARQVGKSTLIRKFAKDQGLNLIEINLEKHFVTNNVFASFDMKKILRELEAIVGEKIDSNSKLLLFLDEIQAAPAAIAALRYFYEDLSWLPVIAAGSLLEFALADFSYSMPVGRVEYRYLGPLGFQEFLAALGEEFLLEALRAVRQEGVSATAHSKLLERQREFLLVGGMPEVVAEFVATENFEKCQSIQGGLLATFQDDFSKYSSGSKLQRLRRVFAQLAISVGRKIKYSNFSKDEKSREIRSALDLLMMAQLCQPVYHSNCSGLPLAATQDYDVYKILFLDVGLLNKALGLSWKQISDLDERTLVNEGVLAEQFVGQELLYRNQGKEAPSLNYWLRDGKSKNAEIDYVISDGQNILPLEVKSGKSGTLRSLHLFAELKNISSAIRLDLNTPSKQKIDLQGKSYELESLPLYCASIIG